MVNEIYLAIIYACQKHIPHLPQPEHTKSYLCFAIARSLLGGLSIGMHSWHMAVVMGVVMGVVVGVVTQACFLSLKKNELYERLT